MKTWLVFLLLSLPVTTSQACSSLIALESWKSIAKNFSEARSVIDPLRNGLTPEARGYALIDMSGVINDAIAKNLFELIPSDGRYNVFDRKTASENPPPDAVKIFGFGFSQTLLEILNHALKDIEPSPLKIKLIQFRRYRKGILAVSEKRNGSENFHVDGRNVYLRAFVTLLGPGLIIGENAPDGIRARQMPRAVVCVFSSAGRTLVHPSVRSTLHRGPTDKGMYESDRLSILVDFSL